jgi:hypothetical protein
MTAGIPSYVSIEEGRKPTEGGGPSGAHFLLLSMACPSGFIRATTCVHVNPSIALKLLKKD